MNQQVENTKRFINTLPFGVRAILQAALLLVIFLVWRAMLWDPLQTSEKNVATKLSNLRGQVANISGQIEGLVADISVDPTISLRLELSDIEETTQQLDRDILALTDALITPQEMVSTLRDLLDRKAGLKVLQLESLKSTPLLENEGASPSSLIKLFRHDMVLKFEGNFFDTLRYLQDVEKSPWRLIWDDITYVVEEYPKAVVTINVHTLSNEGAYLGI